MHSAVKPLPVLDVLSVFADVNPSAVLSAPILIELLTVDGLLILRVPQPLANELGECLIRASLEETVPRGGCSVNAELPAIEGSAGSGESS
jgi:hypothetical protein